MKAVCGSSLVVFLASALLWAQATDSTKLVPIKTDPPVYPLDAQKEGVQGQVWVKIFVDERGRVEKVDVISGNPILTKAAVDAAKKWKFQPFIKNGRPASVTTEMPVDFAFRDKIMEKGVSADRTATSDATTPDRQRMSSDPAARIHVSRGAVAALLLHQVAPVYPPEARAHHVEGEVVLQAVIGKDGRVQELKPLSGPKELIPAALGAVEQWRYQPYLVASKPVVVETQITVNFTLPPNL